MKRLFFLLVLINISYAQTYENIPVNTGWNLIGALEDGPIVNIISTTPPGIIISSFFGYNNQYYSEDTLARGKGYWVKVSQPGLILIEKPVQTSGPCNGISTVYYEGKTYNTVAIGSQCWLRENLNVGVLIPGTSNATNNGVIEKYCYNNDTVNCIKYGGFYQWNEAMQYTTTQGAQGICPIGWHIPTYAQFQALSSDVGGNSNALKAVGQGSGGGEGTNTSGFSALLAGGRNYNGDFNNLDLIANLWSSTELIATHAHNLYLYYSNSTISLNNYVKENGFSVRCLKD